MKPIMTYTHRRMLLVALVAVTSIMTACQSQPTKRGIVIQKGMDYKQVLDAYGKPNDVEYMPSYELTRYFWALSGVRMEQSTYQSSPSVSATGAISPGGGTHQSATVRRIYCDLTVSVDQQNKVASWDAKGTGCRQILYNQI